MEQQTPESFRTCSVQTGAGNCPEFDGGEYNNNIERGEAEFNIVVLRSINTEC
jgi:hypothetical protein